MPSRKLSAHCPGCGFKNPLRAGYCNQCGKKQPEAPVPRDADGRPRLYADIAHPIHAQARESIQRRVVSEYEAELVRAKQPGYVSRYDEIGDIVRARRLPSPQLVGTPERTTLDLNALSDMGVELVGRLAGVRDGRALFSGGLRNLFALADLKLERLLDTFDQWAATHDPGVPVGAVERFEPTRVPASSRLQIDLTSGAIRSVVWATGYHPDYSWLQVPVLDEKGALLHDGGVVESPGLYALGLPVLRRRKKIGRAHV